MGAPRARASRRKAVTSPLIRDNTSQPKSVNAANLHLHGRSDAQLGRGTASAGRTVSPSRNGRSDDPVPIACPPSLQERATQFYMQILSWCFTKPEEAHVFIRGVVLFLLLWVIGWKGPYWLESWTGVYYFNEWTSPGIPWLYTWTGMLIISASLLFAVLKFSGYGRSIRGLAGTIRAGCSGVESGGKMQDTHS